MAEYSLAERLRVARAHKGWSQTELAKRARLHSVQISKLERGYHSGDYWEYAQSIVPGNGYQSCVCPRHDRRHEQ